MFSVYVAATDPLRKDIGEAVKSMKNVLLNATSSDIKEAYRECLSDNPGVLIVQADLLDQWDEAPTVLSEVTFPIVMLANPGDATAAKRAIAMGVQEFFDEGNWQEEMLPVLQKVAQPFVGPSRKQGRVILIFSPKGGVGKSTIALNLALSLGDHVRRPAALLDLDVQFGDVETMVGQSEAAMTLYDLVGGEDVNLSQLQDTLISVDPKLDVLLAPKSPEQAEDIDVAHLIEVLTHLRETYPYVVIDTAPGYNDINVAAMDFCDVIYMVITPDVVTLRTAGQALKVFLDGFHYSPKKIKLLLNRGGTKTGVDRRDIGDMLQTTVGIELPSDGSWPMRAANEGIPLVRFNEKSEFTQAIQDMAKQIVDQEHGGAPRRRPAGQSFFAKFRKK